MVPINSILLPLSVWCMHICARHHIDTHSLHVLMQAAAYWRMPFKPVLASRQLSEYVVLDVEPTGNTTNKFVAADIQACCTLLTMLYMPLMKCTMNSKRPTPACQKASLLPPLSDSARRPLPFASKHMCPGFSSACPPKQNTKQRCLSATVTDSCRTAAYILSLPFHATALSKPCPCRKQTLRCCVQATRAADLGANDRMLSARSHLGALLHPGDAALGYDLYSANLNDPDVEQAVSRGLSMPDVVLVSHTSDRNMHLYTKSCPCCNEPVPAGCHSAL